MEDLHGEPPPDNPLPPVPPPMAAPPPWTPPPAIHPGNRRGLLVGLGAAAAVVAIVAVLVVFLSGGPEIVSTNEYAKSLCRATGRQAVSAQEALLNLWDAEDRADADDALRVVHRYQEHAASLAAFNDDYRMQGSDGAVWHDDLSDAIDAYVDVMRGVERTLDRSKQRGSDDSSSPNRAIDPMMEFSDQFLPRMWVATPELVSLTTTPSRRTTEIASRLDQAILDEPACDELLKFSGTD